MKSEAKVRATPSINGNMIDLGKGYVIAIYERNGVCWVAEFHDGRGKLEYAGSWFRFHAGSRRAALKSPTPLAPEMLEKIERLHRASEAREERMLAVPRAIAAAVRRYWINVIVGLRGHASKISQTLG